MKQYFKQGATVLTLLSASITLTHADADVSQLQQQVSQLEQSLKQLKTQLAQIQNQNEVATEAITSDEIELAVAQQLSGKEEIYKRAVVAQHDAGALQGLFAPVGDTHPNAAQGKIHLKDGIHNSEEYRLSFAHGGFGTVSGSGRQLIDLVKEDGLFLGHNDK